MDVTGIPRVLRERYKEMQEVRDGVFRAVRIYDGHPMLISYFDCTGSVVKEDFDLESYQTGLLAKDYYDNAGSLQWNFYLYFLCNDEDYFRLVRNGAARRLEMDMAYARKFVVRWSDVLHTQDLRVPGMLAGRAVEEDLSVRWKRKLHEVALDGVFLPEYQYAQVIERYIDGDPIVEQSLEGKQSPEVSALMPEFVHGLKLVRYLRYPMTREFEFGISNLIEGPNGSGKTSLLEALELWMCGKTRRNPDSDAVWEIGLRFKGSDGFEIDRGADNAVYRARDLQWYGNHYARGNQSYIGFSRFNFFNSDAAVTMTAERSDERVQEGRVREAIASLVVGATVNIVDERLRQVLARFEEAKRVFGKEIDRLNEEMARAQHDVDIYAGAPADREGLVADLVRDLEKLGWLNVDRQHLETAMGGPSEQIVQIESLLEDCRGRTGWLDSPTPASIAKEREYLLHLTDRILQMNQEMAGQREAIAMRVAERETLSQDLGRLRRLRAYLAHRDVENLAGMDNRIGELRAEIDSCSRATHCLQDVAIGAYAEEPDSIAWLESEYAGEAEKCAGDLERLKLIVAGIQGRQKDASALHVQIRALGRRLLDVCPDLVTCPFCGAKYDPEQLARQLVCESDSDETGELTAYVSKIEELDGRLKIIQRESANLMKLRAAAAALLGEEEARVRPLSHIVKPLSKAKRRCESLRSELDHLEGRRARFREQGLDEEEYRALTAWAQGKYPAMPLSYRSRGQVDQWLRDHSKALASLEVLVERAQRDLAHCEEMKRKWILAYQGALPVERCGERDLHEMSKNLDVSFKSIQTAGQRVRVLDNEPLDGLLLRVRQVREVWEQYRMSIAQLRERSILRERGEARIAAAQQKLNEVEKRNARTDMAVSAMQNTLMTDGKDKYVRHFFHEHLKEISEIFRRIHYPREFSDITFDAEGSPLLARVADGQLSRITCISSGQRAALALSIFLAMNRMLRQGPPYIILDDPVAHIDDLNTLAFLDFLRDTAVTGTRQIFFATANRKVAELYKRKFDFLGRDFKTITLERFDS